MSESGIGGAKSSFPYFLRPSFAFSFEKGVERREG